MDDPRWLELSAAYPFRTAYCSAEEIPSITFDLARIESYRSVPGQEMAAAKYIHEIFRRVEVD